MDYKNAGVDIEAGYKSVELMKKHVQQTATVIALTSWTDKRLRTWLNEFAAAQ